MHRPPAYRLHKPSGQAVASLGGKDFYLGRHGTEESRDEYDRLVAEWLAKGRRFAPAPSGSAVDILSVKELILAYLQFAESYYRKDGAPTSEVKNIRLSLRPLRRLYGRTRAGDFGPLALKAVRQNMIGSGLCRNEVNKRAGRVVRLFRWAVENELVPSAVHHGLKAVSGLRKGRSEAQESQPVRPVPEAFVEAVRPHVSRHVWAMIQVQRLAGMRPGEVTSMRTCDLDMSGRTWAYTPAGHKTEHLGRERTIFVGPRAQMVLIPWLWADSSAYFFNPSEAMEENRAARRKARKTPMTPSQRARKRKRSPERSPGKRYDTRSYYHAVRAACRKADVPAWHPNQLRHNAATALRRNSGLMWPASFSATPRPPSPRSTPRPIATRPAPSWNGSGSGHGLLM